MPTFAAGVVEDLEAEVAGGEVELLQEERIVRDVHLAVEAEELARRVVNGRGVVVNAGHPLLEERADDDDAVLLGGGREPLRARPGDRLGEVEERRVFLLAEVIAGEQLRQADDLRTLLRGVGDGRLGLREVGFPAPGPSSSAPRRW